MAKTDFKTVDEYIATFPPETQSVLKRVRQAIFDAVPDVEEVISYQLPAYKIELIGRIAKYQAEENAKKHN